MLGRLLRSVAGKTVGRLCTALARWRTMADLELLTAADIPLTQGLAQRVTAIRPDLISADASHGEQPTLPAGFRFRTAG